MRKIIAIGCMAAILLSCSEDESPQFSIDGEVLNVTERGVRNAEIKIFREGDDDPIQTIDSDDDGSFSFTLAAGDYEIEVEADGYNTFSDDFSIDEDDDIEIVLEGDAIVTGTIIDSQTGDGMLNATVAFASDEDAEGSEDADLVVTTDQFGQFTIEGAPVGEFTQIVEADGYFTRIVGNVEFEEGDNEVANQTVVEQPEEGSIRVILTWGVTPYDLDSHLTGPTATGTRFHMYYSAKNPTGGNVSLDVDDTYSEGPETTTISLLRAGMYRYSVHNFSTQSTAGAQGIAASPAVVEVYDFDGLVNRFVAPTAGLGDTWRVFEINVSGTNAQINAVNTYVDASSSSDVTVFRTDGKNQKFDIKDF
jgi:hypothetical protein